MSRPLLSIPAVLFVTGISLVVGVLVANGADRAIERNNGIKHPHHFTGHGVRVALGGVVVLGIFLMLSGIVWIVATRRERRRYAGLRSEGNGRTSFAWDERAVVCSSDTVHHGPGEADPRASARIRGRSLKWLDERGKQPRGESHSGE